MDPNSASAEFSEFLPLQWTLRWHLQSTKQNSEPRSTKLSCLSEHPSALIQGHCMAQPLHTGALGSRKSGLRSKEHRATWRGGSVPLSMDGAPRSPQGTGSGLDHRQNKLRCTAHNTQKAAKHLSISIGAHAYVLAFWTYHSLKQKKKCKSFRQHFQMWKLSYFPNKLCCFFSCFIS